MKLKITVGSNAGKVFNLHEGSNLIGRWDPEDKSFPEIDLEEEDVDAKVSRRHCVIINNNSELVIEDAGSLNGTYLNGKKIEVSKKEKIKTGDEITIGKIVLVLED